MFFHFRDDRGVRRIHDQIPHLTGILDTVDQHRAFTSTSPVGVMPARGADGAAEDFLLIRNRDRRPVPRGSGITQEGGDADTLLPGNGGQSAEIDESGVHAHALDDAGTRLAVGGHARGGNHVRHPQADFPKRAVL